MLQAIATVTPSEIVPLRAALGRVLAERMRAPFDVPPADNSAVDGYAVSERRHSGERSRDLVVVADLPAGAVFDGALARGQAIRIMTGAPLPAGAGTVYPQEIVERAGDRVRIGALPPGVNVRRRGEDVASGAAVIEAGTVLRPQELGLAASLGFCQIAVHARPRVALLSTGDEVAEPGTARKPGQIYDANRFALCGSVEQCGGAVIDLGIVPDRREELRARLLEAADMADLVITSGGVSVGVYDLVKEVLAEIGGIDFWQVAMQPGRPLAVGRLGRAHFFGLPGNPVASMLTFLLFVRPVPLQARGTDAPRARPLSGARGRGDVQEAGTTRVQARRVDVARRGLGGPYHRPSGLGHPLLDGHRELSRRDRGAAWRRRARELVLVEPFSGPWPG